VVGFGLLGVGWGVSCWFGALFSVGWGCCLVWLCLGGFVWFLFLVLWFLCGFRQAMGRLGGGGGGIVVVRWAGATVEAGPLKVGARVAWRLFSWVRRVFGGGARLGCSLCGGRHGRAGGVRGFGMLGLWVLFFVGGGGVFGSRVAGLSEACPAFHGAGGHDSGLGRSVGFWVEWAGVWFVSMWVVWGVCGCDRLGGCDSVVVVVWWKFGGPRRRG